jgi:O-antigen/teichoic acid export membrane protein
MSYKKFIKDVAIIGFTQILINSSSFVLLPIITKTLGAYDYGIWAQLSVTVSLLTALASLALSTAFVRFFSSKTDKKEISRGFFSIFFFIALLSLVIIGILFVLSEPISLFLFNTSIYTTLFQITLFLILLNALFTIALFYFRIYRQMLIYTFLGVFASVGGMLLTIFLLIFLDYGLYGIVFSALFSYFLPLVIALVIIIKQVGFSRPSFSEMSKYLRFSLPLAPNSLIFWITDSSDRYIVGFILGTVNVGIYSAAYSIGYIVSLFVFPLQMILFPQLTTLYDNGEIDKVKTYISYSLKFFLLICVPSVVGLTVLARQLFVLLTTSEFTNGFTVIPVIALSALFYGLVQIIINITLVYKKTKFNFWIQVIAALSNIVLNFILIPLFGIIGAAFATLFSFVIMFILAYIVTIKYLRFKTDIVFIFKIILSSLIMASIVFLLEKQISFIFQILAGIIIYSVLCYVLRVFNKKEMSYILQFVNVIKKR